MKGHIIHLRTRHLLQQWSTSDSEGKAWKSSQVLKTHEQQGLQSNKTDPNKFSYHFINITMVFTVGD